MLIEFPSTRVEVMDVTARDGLQAQATTLPAKVRAELVRGLFAAGVESAEAGSFVSPAKVPQMAHPEQVLARLEEFADRLWVVVPNLKGLDLALAAGAQNLVFLVSATETHSRANLGRPLGSVRTDLEEMVQVAKSQRIRLAISMAWVDPDEGLVEPGRVVEIASRAKELGVKEITLCDTYGAASPKAVLGLISRLTPLFPPARVGLHMHDTFGFAGANTLVGLAAGVSRFESTLAGLGGCPFARDAKGNMATENLVRFLHGLNLKTGIDLSALDRARMGLIESLRFHSREEP